MRIHTPIIGRLHETTLVMWTLVLLICGLVNVRRVGPAAIVIILAGALMPTGVPTWTRRRNAVNDRH